MRKNAKRPPYALAYGKDPSGKTYTVLFLREPREVWVLEGDYRDKMRLLIQGLLGAPLQDRGEVRFEGHPAELARKRRWRARVLVGSDHRPKKGRGIMRP